MSRRVLVCGGREYSNREMVKSVLDCVHAAEPVSVLIEGGARGADRLAREWAIGAGVPVETYEADWDRHDKAAGPIRNSTMLSAGKPDLVVAFPGNAGTADMTSKARRQGVTVISVAL